MWTQHWYYQQQDPGRSTGNNNTMAQDISTVWYTQLQQREDSGSKEQAQPPVNPATRRCRQGFGFQSKVWLNMHSQSETLKPTHSGTDLHKALFLRLHLLREKWKRNRVEMLWMEGKSKHQWNTKHTQIILAHRIRCIAHTERSHQPIAIPFSVKSEVLL